MILDRCIMHRSFLKLHKNLLHISNALIRIGEGVFNLIRSKKIWLNLAKAWGTSATCLDELASTVSEDNTITKTKFSK